MRLRVDPDRLAVMGLTCHPTTHVQDGRRLWSVPAVVMELEGSGAEPEIMKVWVPADEEPVVVEGPIVFDGLTVTVADQHPTSENGREEYLVRFTADGFRQGETV